MKDKESPTPESIMLSELITEEEGQALVAYLNQHRNEAPLRNNILDWLGTQPVVLERMNKRQIILTYFGYMLEYAITNPPPQDEQAP